MGEKGQANVADNRLNRAPTASVGADPSLQESQLQDKNQANSLAHQELSNIEREQEQTDRNITGNLK